MHNRIATTRDNELYIACYETEEPKEENYSEIDIELFSAYDIDHKQWQSTKREYKVREEDKEEVITEMYARSKISLRHVFVESISKGIPCDFLADRLELVEPDKNGVAMFEPFWFLKPLVVEQERNDVLELLDELEMHIMINEHDWNRSPQAMFNDFKNQILNNPNTHHI